MVAAGDRRPTSGPSADDLGPGHVRYAEFSRGRNPTAGGLVTTGPYRYIRHPIYTAVLLFTWAGAIANWSLPAIGLAVALTVGAGVRMWCEEQMVVITYPEYREYARVTKRVIPGVL